MDKTSLRSAVFAEIQRIICDVEPPRPSTRLAQDTTRSSTTASYRATEPRKLARMVRGELDWIVMKAIEKDRARRYETANGLAMDLRRFLAAEPVLAALPSASYRLKKFVGRNKGTVAAGSLVVLSLLVGIAGFAWQARIAQARANELEQVSKFQAEMLAQVDPTHAGILLSDDVRSMVKASLAKAGLPEAERSAQLATFATQWQRVNATDAARNLIDRTILKPAVAAIDKQFKTQPLVDAALRQVVADRYVGMGNYDAAMPLQQAALAVRRRELGETHPDTLKSAGAMGELLQAQGKLDDAEALLRKVLEGSRRTLGDDAPDTLDAIGNVGGALYEKGKLAEAEVVWREGLQRSRRARGPSDPQTLGFLNNLGTLLSDEGKQAEAERFYRDALDGRRRVLGEDDPATVNSLNNLGVLLQEEGKMVEAETYQREALQKYRRIAGEDHPDTLNAINNLGVLLRLQGKLAESETYAREVVEKRRHLLGEDHPSTLASEANLAVLLSDEGKLPEAVSMLRNATERSRAVMGEQHPTTLIFVGNLGAMLEDQGQHAEAGAMLAAAEPATRKAFTGADNAFRVSKLLMALGKTRLATGQFATAEKNLIEADANFARFPSPRPKDMRDCRQAIVNLYVAWDIAEPGKGHDAKALEWKKKLEALPSTIPRPAAS